MHDSKETVSSGHNSTGVHIEFTEIAETGTKPDRFKTNEVSAQRRKSRHRI